MVSIKAEFVSHLFSDVMVSAELCVAAVGVDHVECVFRMLFFTQMYIILFCNLVCIFIHKMCEDKFGGCKKSFSWVGQKVNKK